MYYWLAGVVLALLVWWMVWRIQPKMAFGMLLGLPIAWVVSRLITPYLTGVEQVPVWLPPLPFAIVAILLLVSGAMIWFRGAPPPSRDDAHEH